MQWTFYDVKARKKVTTDVVEKVKYGGGDKKESFAFRGKTSDGRNLTAFVNKDAWAEAKV